MLVLMFGFHWFDCDFVDCYVVGYWCCAFAVGLIVVDSLVLSD